MDVLVINGPNLNYLGHREVEIYGTTTLADVEAGLQAQGAAAGLDVVCFQSNHEGAIIDQLYEARPKGVRYVIINPGGLTHTSVALRDAFSGLEMPFIEVHVSNIHAREEFRRHSLLAEIASGAIIGMGVYGYTLAMDAVIHRLGVWN